MASALRILTLLPKPYIDGTLETGCGVILFDSTVATDDLMRRDRWRDWLHAFNTLRSRAIW